MAMVTSVHETPNGNLRVGLAAGGVVWVPNDPTNPHYKRTVQPWLEAGGTIQPLPQMGQSDQPEPDEPEVPGEPVADPTAIPTADSIRGWDGLVMTLIESSLLMRSQLKQETVDVINRQRALDGRPPL